MRNCFFCQKGIKEIHHSETETLKKYLTPLGKILSRKRSGLCAKHQRQLARSVKRARILGLIPFTNR